MPTVAQFMDYDPFDSLPETSLQNLDSNDPNFKGGFDDALKELIAFAERESKIDRPGVAGTENTHIAGYEAGMAAALNALKKIQRKGH